MQFEDTSIQEIISHSVAAVKPSAEARNLSIKIASNEARCKADGARLIQVLVNLLSNAIKFSPIGSAIKILIEEKGELIRIAVADSGKGVPEDKQKLIFEKFAQLERKDWQQRGGTGLGLAICKIIIEQHHGQIGVENSRSESGSIFWFEIPKTQNG
jgi:signal transduction histidine kinase